jgi:hypothetical protein
MAVLNRNQFYYLDTNEKILRENTSVWQIRTEFENVDSYYFEFKHANAFEVFPLETLIEPTEIERIRNKEITLVLCNSHEAFHSVVEGIYIHVLQRLNIPPEQVVLISESFDILTEVKRISLLYNMGEIKAEWICIFENSIRRQKLEFLLSEPIKQPNLDKVFTKKFLNFNRRWRLHRPSLVALLCANNLIEHGHISLGDCDDRANWSTVWHSIKDQFNHNQEIKNLLLFNEQRILNLPMMYLDSNNLMENKPNLEVSSNKFYDETYFSVVSETNYFTKSVYSLSTETGRFLSEKTFKPIAQCHPFLIVSVPNSLDTLRELGYKSFSPWIDESYDTELDDANRLLKIVAEIKRLSELSTEQVREFRQGVHDICTFNLGVLLRKNPAENIRKLN